MVFPEKEADDHIGPYQEIAPPLLTRSDVRWFMTSPDADHLIPISAHLMSALIGGDAVAAAMLMTHAIAEYAERLAQS